MNGTAEGVEIKSEQAAGPGDGSPQLKFTRGQQWIEEMLPPVTRWPLETEGSR